MHILPGLPPNSRVLPYDPVESVLDTASLSFRLTSSPAWPTIARFADWSDPQRTDLAELARVAERLVPGAPTEPPTRRMSRLAIHGAIACRTTGEPIPQIPVQAAVIVLEHLTLAGRPPSIAQLIGLTQALVPLERVQQQQRLRTTESFVFRRDSTWKACYPAAQVRDSLRNLLVAAGAAMSLDHPPIPIGAWMYRGICLIHPLYDGNGRLARALASSILLAKGRPPLIFRPSDELGLRDALISDPARSPSAVTTLFAELDARTIAELTD